MSDPAPRTPPPAWAGPLAVGLLIAGVAAMVAGQVWLSSQALAYVGLALVAVGVVFGVISQKGR